MKRLIFTAALLAVPDAAAVRGEIVYNGAAISENFNSLGTLTVTPAFSGTIGVQSPVPGSTGFEGTRIAGSFTNNSALILNDGTVGTGGVQNFGVTDATDRALGLLAHPNRTMAFGFALRNNVAGATITSITITFNQENWRTPTLANNTLTAAWATSAAAGVTETNYLTASGMTAVPELNMTLAFTASNTPLDGNSPANQIAKSFTFSSLNLAFNDRLFLRWQDVDNTGDDAGIGMDDMTLSFVVSVVPEAAAWALVAVAAGGAGISRVVARRRRPGNPKIAGRVALRCGGPLRRG
jgi:hypothetical protein